MSSTWHISSTTNRSTPIAVSIADSLLIKGHKLHARSQDHIIAKTKSKHLPEITRQNLYGLFTVYACLHCNGMKAAMSLSEFRDAVKNKWVHRRILILSGLKKLIN